jgi:hypothetical protein
MRRSLPRGWPSVVALVVFALAAGALLLQNGSLAHVHSAAKPGFYNHDHDLTLLATFGGGAPVPDGAPLVSWLPDVAAASVPDLSHPAASPLRYSASRAPPLAG